MISLNEDDLVVVGKIQERKNCTLARARETYRSHAAKLADPSRLDRHAIIWDNIQSGVKISEPTKESKEKKAMPKKEAKKKAAKKKAAAPAEPRPEVELAELTRDVELTAVEDSKHVHTANLFGKKHAVLWMSANHDNPGTAARFAPLHLSEQKLDEVKAYASKNDLPLAVCVTVRVKGRADQGYAVPADVLKECSTKMSRGRVSLSLSAESRLAYREKGWDGCKFAVAKIAPSAAA